MTVKFSIRHHYKDVPIEITVEAERIADLSLQMQNTIDWIATSRKLIDKFYEQTKKLPEKEQKQNEV